MYEVVVVVLVVSILAFSLYLAMMKRRWKKEAARKREEEKRKLEKRRAVEGMLYLLNEVPLDEVVSACEKAGIDVGHESLRKLFPYDPHWVGQIYGSLLLAVGREDEEKAMSLTIRLGMELGSLDYGEGIAGEWLKEFFLGMDSRHPKKKFGEEARKQYEEQLVAIQRCHEEERRKSRLKQGIEAFKAS